MKDIKQTREEVVSQLLAQFDKADGYTKQQMLLKLVERLPDDFVSALYFAYDLYKPAKEGK